MPRATTAGGSSAFGPKSVAAFVLGIGVGLVLVAPALPATVGPALADVVDSGGSVILVGVVALTVLMVLLAVLYQGYLRT